MAGLFIQLLISWLLLWFVSRKHLSVLGFYPSQQRLVDFTFGLLMAAACCAAYYFASAALAGNGFKANPGAGVQSAMNGAWYMFKSVLFEELIFRGAVLYLLIQWFGNLKASVISAVCFGVYHWFSYNLFGNPLPMAIVFFMTAIAGFTFAISFAVTRSLYLPFALHFGWNYMNSVVFPNGPLADPLLVYINSNKLEGIPSLLVFLFQVLSLPGGVYLYSRSRRRSYSE